MSLVKIFSFDKNGNNREIGSETEKQLHEDKIYEEDWQKNGRDWWKRHWAIMKILSWFKK